MRLNNLYLARPFWSVEKMIFCHTDVNTFFDALFCICSLKLGKFKVLGMTIMEALVAAVIVGIGFIVAWLPLVCLVIGCCCCCWL